MTLGKCKRSMGEHVESSNSVYVKEGTIDQRSHYVSCADQNLACVTVEKSRKCCTGHETDRC